MVVRHDRHADTCMSSIQLAISTSWVEAMEGLHFTVVRKSSHYRKMIGSDGAALAVPTINESA
jgi:hypothetical protein